MDKLEKYSGLAHVTEHACLCEHGRIGDALDHFRGGFTCLSHLCLFYSTANDLVWLSKIKEQIYSGKIVSRYSVKRAKLDVIAEYYSTLDKTKLREKIVRFVTENRIKYFAMGDPYEIEKIRFYDVKEFLLEAIHQKRVYLVEYSKKQEVISSFEQLLCGFDYKKRSCQKNNSEDDYLFLTDDGLTTVEVYIQLENTFEEKTFLYKAFIEFFLLWRLGAEFSISFDEKFFSKLEKYTLVRFHNFDRSKIKEIPSLLREALLSLLTTPDFELLREDFARVINNTLKYESTFDYINKYKNMIVFGKPIFRQDDFSDIYLSKDHFSKEIYYYLQQGYKIVVR